MKSIFEGKRVLVTGGSGTIGAEIVRSLLPQKPKVIRIFSRDETKQFFLHEELANYSNLRFLVGDIRDRERLERAAEDIDIILHCAALKHVMSCEYNAFEAVKTNVVGTQNVIDVALHHNVEKVIYTSSDKAANPANTMGTTKLLGERLMTSANYHRGNKRTIFASVRFGNVMGSRGSVIPLFRAQIERGGPLTLTSETMTRFMMSLKNAVQLVFECTSLARGGEIFILKMPVVLVRDLAELMIEHLGQGKRIAMKVIGPKPGEAMYEKLMTSDEAKATIDIGSMYVLLPSLQSYGEEEQSFELHLQKYYKGKSGITTGYISSDMSPISKSQAKALLQEANVL